MGDVETVVVDVGAWPTKGGDDFGPVGPGPDDDVVCEREAVGAGRSWSEYRRPRLRSRPRRRVTVQTVGRGGVDVARAVGLDRRDHRPVELIPSDQLPRVSSIARAEDADAAIAAPGGRRR